MYILSVIAVILGTVVMSFLAEAGVLGFLQYLDLANLVLLAIFTIPMLIASNLLKDFNNAFRLSMKKSEIKNVGEIKRAIEAVNLVMKTLIVAGGFIAIFIFCVMMNTLSDPASLGPKCAIALFSLLYALAINLCLLPLKSRLKIRLQEFLAEE